MPVIFVANVEASAEFLNETLGFSIDFLHGEPPFYGSVSRDGACVHLKFVHEPVLTVGAEDRNGFIVAFIGVENVKALYGCRACALCESLQPDALQWLLDQDRPIIGAAKFAKISSVAGAFLECADA